MQTFPGQVNTATSANAQTQGAVSIRFDPTYIRTQAGILKIARMVLDFIGFICVATSQSVVYSSRCNWYNSISMIGFWGTGILLIFYLFHIIEKFQRIPWLKIELIYCGIVTVCYLLAAALVAGAAWSSEALGAAAFFGFSAMCCYGFDAWLKFKAMKSGEVAQGLPQTSRNVSTVGSPAGY